MKKPGMKWQAAWVALAALAAAPQAFVLDGVAAPLPTPVADGRLTIGARSLALPEGNWTLLGRAEGHIKLGSDRRASHFTLYAMDVADGQMRQAVVARLPVNSTPVNRWTDDPCKSTGYLLRDDFGEVANTAQCLLVHKRRTHLASSGVEGVYAQAQQWAAAQPVQLKGPFYEIYYARYASNDFGWVRVFVPTAAFAGDEEALAWARQLPTALQRFFEHRDREATLPALSHKAS